MSKLSVTNMVKKFAAEGDAKDFIEFLEEFKFRYHILDQDNILDYNEGMLNIEVAGTYVGESFLFIDGEYQK